MTDYAILAYPGHNRVYFAESAAVSLAELRLALARVAPGCEDVCARTIGGVPYYVFRAPDRLDADAVARVYQLSCVYALFERRDELLRPVADPATAFMDSSIGTILKYPGKTNELFTRLMINLALDSRGGCGPARLLDPVCGRATTLFEGLRLGLDVCGIDIDDKAVHAAAVFFKKYLENARFKHTDKTERRSGPNKSFTLTVRHFELAPTKEAFADPASRRALTLVSGDTRHSVQIWKRESFDILVGDLAYGVAHANVAGPKRRAGARNPAELLRECLPVWRALLKPGGAMALSWNTFLLGRQDFEGLLRESGFCVCDGPDYDGLAHRVDQAIRRDVIVARRECEG